MVVSGEFELAAYSLGGFMEFGKKFLHRAVSVFCAVVVAVSCLGSVPYYADEDAPEGDVYFVGQNLYVKDFDYSSINLPSVINSYNYYMLAVNNDSYYLFLNNEPFSCVVRSAHSDGMGDFYYLCFPSASTYYLLLSDGSWKQVYSGISYFSCRYFLGNGSDASYNGFMHTTGGMLLECNSPIYSSSGTLLVNAYAPSVGIGGDIFSSSLGYLQDINRQFLYLEDDSFSLVEDTAACRFTFANTTTTGLDITNGNWSIRHYMEIEVKNAKKEYETVEIYDKVYLNEYPASDCKILYKQKDTIERLHEESGFDGLSWWDSNFLGYITYYNDYFQLVRTNEDGSVEYGGYVKVWQDEYNINHSSTLGEDGNQDDSGYNDNIVPGSHGSGDTYEEAEHDADENAANSSNSSGETLDELNNILSTISAVPEAFARMFSFLPDWCLTSIGISIVVGFAIVIWKAGRG